MEGRRARERGRERERERERESCHHFLFNFFKYKNGCLVGVMVEPPIMKPAISVQTPPVIVCFQLLQFHTRKP